MPAADVIRMVTMNAARTLGIDDTVGSLETGKAVDTICIEPDIVLTSRRAIPWACAEFRE